jgi:RNA polymerase sigma-70 factor (ECF subfamily)
VRQDLVERAQRGDREAFGELAANEIDHLLVIARLVLRDPDLAEDAVQDALVRCWKSLPKLREIDRFDAWLRRILMRSALDQVKRRPRFDVSVENLRMEPSVADTSESFMHREELARGFRVLSTEHRAVVVLHHYVGLSMADVASALGIPVGTAKSRYHYAMSALRAALDADARVGDARELLA